MATCKDSAASKNEEGCIVENALPACGSSGELKTGGCVGDSVKAGCTETNPDAEVAVKTLEGYSETNLLLKECTKATNAAVSCIAGVDLFASPPSVTNKPMFLSKNWRALLCRCGNCTAFYTQKGVGFLLDHEDSIVEYEKMAKQKREEKLHQEETSDASFLNGLGHVEKIEILSGISDMKNELLSFMVSLVLQTYNCLSKCVHLNYVSILFQIPYIANRCNFTLTLVSLFPCRGPVIHQEQSHLMISTRFLRISARSEGLTDL